jgi:ribose-phosphate pyrophosphokinase
MPHNESATAAIAQELGSEAGSIELRQFPDGETYLRYATDPAGRDIAIVCTLDRPDGKFLPLLFAAKTARDLGAKRIGLVAPYLAYMRQDRRFHTGEAVTSRCTADLLSGAFDWLVTVEPHLHRYRTLDELYTIPSRAVGAAPAVSAWIISRSINGVLIGPDQESENWISEIAKSTSLPFTVLKKTRWSDNKVEIRVRDAGLLTGRTPVIVDDIISSGGTLREVIQQVREQTQAKPICIGIHGIFANGSDQMLAAEGAELVTCNTVPHATNTIDVTALIVEGMTDVIQRR